MVTLELLSLRLVADLKTIRLRALQETPLAFGSTYARESQLSDADWLSEVATWNSGANSVCYLAMDEGAPCGIIAGRLDDGDPPTPNVASMWVAPSHRRSGLGSRLMGRGATMGAESGEPASYASWSPTAIRPR